ncbi:hypothetical protein [Candidatus Mesenet endosymbiont of Phosphuga atrata]|uniref:hypothetical protein n=1 Tax=Candidatus Mesenet endosymbiont of Phosphuga atrata TaxID=3066221 RepID=UPI0030D48EC3
MPGKGKDKNKRATSSGNSPIGQQGDITKTNLEKEQTTPTEKDESIESTATNNDNILEQQQNITARNVSGKEDSISEKTSIELDFDAKSLDEDIEQTNKTNVDNPQVGQDSGFNELPFSEHGGSDDIEVVSADGAHTKLDSDGENKSVKQTSEARNEIKVDQVSTVQSPVSTEADYATPLERSESSNTKTINNDNSVRQEDDIDNDTDERELEDDSKPEEKSNLILTTVHSSDDEDLSADDTSKPELKEEENEHEVEKNIRAQSRKESLSDGESLIDSTPDSSTPHTKTSRMSKDSSILSDHNSPKKKVSKSLFTNFSKGQKIFLGLTIFSMIASTLSLSLLLFKIDKLHSAVALAISGTFMIAFGSIFLCYSNDRSKKNDPLSKFDSNGVEMLMPESKKNK